MNARPAQLVEQARERFGLEDYYGAIHLLEECVANGRAFADAFNLLGLCYGLVDQPERALEAFDRALDLNPHYVEALMNRGVVLASVGRADEALEAFDAARSSGGSAPGGELPRHHAAGLANQHAALGEAYAEAGRLPEAIVQYQRALELGPAFHDLRYRLGQFLVEAGRTLEARDAFGAVVQARPHSPDPRSAFGLACYLSGDSQTARKTWEDMRREFPDDPRPKAYLAMLDRGEP